MESIHSPKKPGAARVGVLAGGLLVILLLALPGAWYAAYHDQMTASAAGSVRFGVALPSRPSGVIPQAPPAPGTTRTVQIQHVGGQIITTINDGDMRITARTTDPRPPSGPVDTLGQNLCDRYNAWRCARGDSHQPANTIGPSTGSMILQMVPPSAHAPGTPAP